MDVSSISLRLLLAVAALAAPGLAHAQAYQCRVPQTVTVPKIVPDAAPRRTQIRGYTLALSWSPEFCKGRERHPSHAAQCGGRNGRFGLVVHGLWPEGAGAWPQWCPARRAPTPAEVRANMCLTPSARLIAHEWAKHGSCMVRRPDTYLKVTRILWNGLRIPDYDRLSRKEDLTAGDIRNSLADANEGWEAEDIGVTLNARGWLTELKLCYDVRFRPQRCDTRRFGAKDERAAKIWRGL